MNFADDLDKYLDATRKRLKPELDQPIKPTDNAGSLPDHERYFYNAERDIWYDVLTDSYSKYDAKRRYYIPVTFGPPDDVAVDEPESDATCRLVVKSSTVVPVGKVVLTDANGMILGRDKHEWDTRTTRLRDMQVSKVHCQVFYDHERQVFCVTDMGSQNGTLLNDERLSLSKQSSRPFDLAHGDTLTVGVTVFQVHLHDHGWPCQQCQTSAVNTTTPEKKPHQTPTKPPPPPPPPTRKQWQKQLLKAYDTQDDEKQKTRYIDRAKLRRDRADGSERYSLVLERPAEVVDLQTPVQGKGYDMLRKMGWQNGQGMGSAQQGITVPLAPTSTPYARAGLGVTTVSKKERLAHQMKQRYGQ